jgi:hypothetical protein
MRMQIKAIIERQRRGNRWRWIKKISTQRLTSLSLPLKWRMIGKRIPAVKLALRGDEEG